MWQGHRRDHRHLLECVRLEHFHCIQSANCHVSKLTVRVTSKVDVIGDRSRVEHFDDVERWPCVKHHGLADVLERQPDLPTVWARCDVRAERTFLFHWPTILCSAVAMTTVSGLKLEQTYPYFPSGENIVIPGPFGTVMRVLSLKVWPSR